MTEEQEYKLRPGVKEVRSGGQLVGTMPDDKSSLTVEGLIRLYPESAADFIKSLIDQGRRKQHREDVDWLKSRCVIPDFIATISIQDWGAFKEMPIS